MTHKLSELEPKTKSIEPKLLDTYVCVMLYEGQEKCAFKSVDDCSNAIFKEDPADLLAYDWRETTFREWSSKYHKLGLLGEPSIEP